MKFSFFFAHCPTWAMACMLLSIGGIFLPLGLSPLPSVWIIGIKLVFGILGLTGIGGTGYQLYRRGHKAQAAQVWVAGGMIALVGLLGYVWWHILLTGAT